MCREVVYREVVYREVSREVVYRKVCTGGCVQEGVLGYVLGYVLGLYTLLGTPSSCTSLGTPRPLTQHCCTGDRCTAARCRGTRLWAQEWQKFD